MQLSVFVLQSAPVNKETGDYAHLPMLCVHEARTLSIVGNHQGGKGRTKADGARGRACPLWQEKAGYPASQSLPARPLKIYQNGRLIKQMTFKLRIA